MPQAALVMVWCAILAMVWHCLSHLPPPAAGEMGTLIKFFVAALATLCLLGITQLALDEL
jgi:hypothetical protein